MQRAKKVTRALSFTRAPTRVIFLSARPALGACVARGIATAGASAVSSRAQNASCGNRTHRLHRPALGLVRKPLMERKRRERINSSLEQLALLLKEAKLVAADKPVAKLEKADILELTVRHLKSVRRNANIVSTPPQEETNITKCSIKREIENSPNIKKTDLATNGNLITDEIPNPLKPIQTSTKVSDEAPTALDGETSEKTGKEARDSSYIEGFHMCLSEVKQAAESAQELGALKDRIFDHLETCLLNLPPDTTSNERIGNEKRARSQENDCETKAKRKRKKLGHHEESDLAQKACSEAVTEVTLVPMQLSDGRVAFLMQGDAKILITEKNNDSQDPQNPTYSPVKIEQPILNSHSFAIEAKFI
ncbi:hypothetical protein HAZT_HAZT002200 [Hyalella azteca]|uniref:BHLH domain-containing protein n=1 Tax=Hyalella azteca TaxID=294128 RepID=A0A6A0GZ59_HYAAZ|nr:hypothetical protein HAZT_HAZT002200 [Hyalella azteca]